MSATSGIAVSTELSSTFGSAVESRNVRFLKISIRNESLVPDESISISGTLEDDFRKLADIVEDNTPAYVLVRLDDPPSEWLVIYYVPDSAKVRDKMLYAATRNNLTKSLGSAHFTDSMFATSKNDVTAEAYKKHRAHLAAPKPMSAWEKEMAEVKAAEREAGGGSYDGSRSRQSVLGKGLGFKWTDDVEDAVKDLANGEDGRLVVITVDPTSESLLLSFVVECTTGGLGSAIPANEPSYAFFAWPQTFTTPPRREIVFIYSCPSSSPVKNRMLYSSGSRAVYQSAKLILGDSTPLASRKIETSDPKELDEGYLKTELLLSDSPASTSGAGTPSYPAEAEEQKAFARPRGPARRTR